MADRDGAARSAGLGDACVREALAIIAETGIDALSLREVARRLKVSHGAPYKHYPSRDHLLAEVVRRIFDGFAAHLDAAGAGDDPRADMRRMGAAYLDYALARPLEYGLMFGAGLPDPAQHPQMAASAGRAFDLLRNAMARLPSHAGKPQRVAMDALFVWASLHGLASILRCDVAGTIGIDPLEAEAMLEATLRRIGVVLEAPDEAGLSAG